MTARTLRNLRVPLLLVVALGVPLSAASAVPGFTQAEGVLSATGGGPVADGDYAVSFKLYDAETGGNVLWSEGPVTLAVKGGSFGHALGSQQPLSAQVLAGQKSVWLGVAVGGNPELPRKAVAAVPFTLRAAVAEGVDCSGCVGLSQLAADVLAPYAKTAGLAKVATSGAWGDIANKPTFANVAMTGAFPDLSGVPVIPKVGAACGTGLVMAGIKADGSYDCVAGGGAVKPADLPGDGLDEVSNGLLFNQFQELAASTKTPIGIPDNNPVGISDVIDVPDFGTAEAITISAEVANSDTTNLQIMLIDSANAKYLLWDKTAKGTLVKTSWPSPTKTLSGDLSTWIGKNPKGKWYLQVIDTAFLNNGTDGQIKAWSIQVQVLASGKVGVGGALVLKNAADPPFPCTASTKGALYFDTKTNAIRYCALGVWRSLADTCGNGILESNEDCDDSNNADGDGCSSICTSTCGDGKSVGKEPCDDGNQVDTDACTNDCKWTGSYGTVKTMPGPSCGDILDKHKTAGITLVDGGFWVDLTGGDPGDAVQAYCDMGNGGWTYKAINEPFKLAFTGAVQTITTPAVATQYRFTAFGAQGGLGAVKAGGLGGKVEGTKTFAPGTTLFAFVGGQGASGGPQDQGSCSTRTGGYNGGGRGSQGGSGGGGASDIRTQQGELSTRVLVAAGGGGCGYNSCDYPGGAGGGLTGSDASGVSAGVSAGGGGTQSAGGTPASGNSSGNGALGTGGANVQCNDEGGGGGGYYGGSSGGTANTPGGGGSSYLGGLDFGATTTPGVRSGNGEIQYIFK
ncbi:MAG: DUF4215 domain-containing protein [Myxococcales bacterium]|nr:DUF4215 domain-containing protein [Myxococcales bacterium]